MSKKNKEFPQTELQEQIYEFWSVRGYESVSAVLGNLSVKFHKTNPKYECLGLDYQYLEQFWDKAKEEQRKELHNYIKNNNLIEENYKKILIDHLEIYKEVQNE
jgi:hypothetical protein